MPSDDLPLIIQGRKEFPAGGGVSWFSVWRPAWHVRETHIYIPFVTCQSFTSATVEKIYQQIKLQTLKHDGKAYAPNS
jgi:hypothetical protein